MINKSTEEFEKILKVVVLKVLIALDSNTTDSATLIFKAAKTELLKLRDSQQLFNLQEYKDP